VSPAAPRPGRRWAPALNALLFLLTVATTLLAGAGMVPLAQAGLDVRGVVEAGLPFAASLVGILLAHEMGHYVLARGWRVDTTLPYCIPVPFGIGTLGALLRIRSPIPTRAAEIDIGVAGPVAGLVVAVPLYAWGLAHSEVRAVGEVATSNAGSPWAILMAWIQGQPIAAGAGDVQLMGDSMVTWLVGRAVWGALPAGQDVMLHPVAFAAWLGLFVTALNLIPLGQLDGGHALYGLFGARRALALSRLTSAGLLLAGIFLSWNWLVWWAITRFAVRLGHPPALDESPPPPGRRALALVALLLFAATFIPVPMQL
jgi:membrane-associated protease RseP (regulator of RpoE activity)